MNENKVLRIEKRASNKVGLFILAIILLAGVGFGVYYYLTNKDYISFDFSVPWKKKEKKDEVIKDAEGLRSNPEEKINREKTEFNIGSTIYTEELFNLTLLSVTYNEESYNFKITATNTSPHTISLNIKDILVNGYSTRTSLESRMNPEDKAAIDFNITKET